MTSKACCTIPPVVASGYEPKGTYSEFAGMKTYVTGNKNAKTAVLSIFDVFGFFPQTIQGLDMIAVAGDHLAVMPDFFFGKTLDIALFPPDTDEKKATIGNFIAGVIDFAKAAEIAAKVLAEVNSAYPNIEAWGVIGYCWGGKVTALMSGASSPFKVSVQVHPGRPDPEDAAKFTIPHMCLASSDESAEAIAGIAEALKTHPNEAVRTKSVVETYGTMYHGWMAARAKLEEEESAREYERAYKQVVNFFQDNLTTTQ